MGFLFSRVLRFYGLGYIETMKMPVKTFWHLNENVDRIRAEEDQRQFQLVNQAQHGGEQAGEYLEKLNKAVGNVFVADGVVIHAERDEAGFNSLRMMAG